MTQKYVGLYHNEVSDVSKILKETLENSYDGMAAPIVNRLFNREFFEEPIKSKHLVFSRSDLILHSEEWIGRVVTILSDNIECDSPDVTLRKQGEQTLIQEINFAEHLIQNGHMIMRLHGGRNVNLAKIVSRNLKGIFLVHIPITNPNSAALCHRKDIDIDYMTNTDSDDPWYWWNNFRMVTDFHPKIRLALELTEDIPSEDKMQRWLGEPVDCLIISSTLFKRNRNNYPVLPNSLLAIVRQFKQRNLVYFFVKTNIDEGGACQNYAEYLKFVSERYYQHNDTMKSLGDVLEIPLQPLFDNLDSYTYEVFEKDPVKYKLYQKAIEAALCDKVPENEIKTKTMIIMVVGAGRGPLVRAALNASENTKRKIKIYIIEKNPNALITLTALNQEVWKGKDITIFSKDIRDFEPPEKADILVSELLGSFGDNELSPECLDGAQKHLKEDGISIPSKSTSYLNPVMSSTIFNNVRSVFSDRNSTFRSNFTTPAAHFEFTYVVHLRNVYHIDKPQECFTFIHPNKDKMADNTRFTTLRFKAHQDCILHGFAGYFDTVLYKDITLSIHPLTHTQGLYSWFSCFFPISEPQMLKENMDIELNMWRCVSSQKVWYEWNLNHPKITHIHNQNGQHCSIYK